MDRDRDARFALVTAANHFLFASLPLTHPRSAAALSLFVESIRHSLLPRADVDAVLIRVLGVLNPYFGGHRTSLTDLYVAKSSMRLGDAESFLACVSELLCHRGIGDPVIEEAVARIESQHSDPGFSLAELAIELSLAPHSLSRRFKAVTGLTPQEYLRNVRLDRAATTLVSSTKSVKEIWVAIGYNHAANFDHAFRRRFGMTPTEYRGRSVHANLPSPTMVPSGRELSSTSDCYNAARPSGGISVLIVDDDAVCCDTLGAMVDACGYAARTAQSGEAGLRELERRLPAVILLDYQLPDLNGVDFLRTLRGRHPGYCPPVAVLTADWEIEHHRRELLTLGATIESKLCDPAGIPRLLASLGLMPIAP